MNEGNKFEILLGKHFNTFVNSRYILFFYTARIVFYLKVEGI